MDDKQFNILCSKGTKLYNKSKIYASLLSIMYIWINQIYYYAYGQAGHFCTYIGIFYAKLNVFI